MKLVSFVIFAILSLCFIFAEANTQQVARDSVDVTFYKYTTSGCKGEPYEDNKETGDCFSTDYGKSEKVGTVSNGKLSVTCYENGHCGNSNKKGTLTFEKNKCTKDQFTGSYVKWDW